jgi:hypothetical protein
MGGGGQGEYSLSFAANDTANLSSPMSATGGGGFGSNRGAGAVFNVQGIDGKQLAIGAGVALLAGFIVYKLVK